MIVVVVDIVVMVLIFVAVHIGLRCGNKNVSVTR